MGNTLTSVINRAAPDSGFNFRDIYRGLHLKRNNEDDTNDNVDASSFLSDKIAIFFCCDSTSIIDTVTSEKSFRRKLSTLNEQLRKEVVTVGVFREIPALFGEPDMPWIIPHDTVLNVNKMNRILYYSKEGSLDDVNIMAVKRGRYIRSWEGRHFDTLNEQEVKRLLESL